MKAVKALVVVALFLVSGSTVEASNLKVSGALSSIAILGKGKSREFENIKNATAGKPVLTITDSYNLGHKGSCINFKVIDGKLKFELNQASVNGANLKVSGQLSSMAIVI